MSILTANTEPSYKNEPAYRFTSIVVPLLVAIVVLLFIWYSRDQVQIKEPRIITLYCFSAMEPVMEQGILPAFQDHWLEQHQERVEFITTFAGSGVITSQIMTRFPAEVAILSSELDVRRLVSGGIISQATWQELRQQDKFCRSPVVLFISKDIQRPIHGFEDIDFETMNVIIPDPLTSGEGQMTSLAIYGSQLRKGLSQSQAFSFTRNAFKKAQSHPSTSRDALEQFYAGMGDVLFNYEATAWYHPGVAEMNMVYPKSTLMVEPMAVAIQQNITPKQIEITDDFVAFLWSELAQRKLSEYGFQTINTDTQPEFVQASEIDIFTLDSLGTANDLNHSIIDQLLKQDY